MQNAQAACRNVKSGNDGSLRRYLVIPKSVITLSRHPDIPISVIPLSRHHDITIIVIP